MFGIVRGEWVGENLGPVVELTLQKQPAIARKSNKPTYEHLGL